MQPYQKKYLDTLNTWINECKANSEALENDFREDEAKLEKIKLNVYSIFMQMFNLSLKKTKSSAAFNTMYLAFHQSIPKNWHTAREQAQKDDTIEYYIETIKIDTALRIEKLFTHLVDNYEQS